MRLHGKDYSAASLARMAGDLAAAGGVRSVVLGDGAERGLRALEFRTGGGLNFDVLVDRAMDIGSGWPSSWSTTRASSRRSSSGCTCARARTRSGSSRARTA